MQGKLCIFRVVLCTCVWAQSLIHVQQTFHQIHLIWARTWLFLILYLHQDISLCISHVYITTLICVHHIKIPFYSRYQGRVSYITRSSLHHFFFYQCETSASVITGRYQTSSLICCITTCFITVHTLTSSPTQSASMHRKYDANGISRKAHFLIFMGLRRETQTSYIETR